MSLSACCIVGSHYMLVIHLHTSLFHVSVFFYMLCKKIQSIPPKWISDLGEGKLHTSHLWLTLSGPFLACIQRFTKTTAYRVGFAKTCYGLLITLVNFSSEPPPLPLPPLSLCHGRRYAFLNIHLKLLLLYCITSKRRREAAELSTQQCKGIMFQSNSS